MTEPKTTVSREHSVARSDALGEALRFNPRHRPHRLRRHGGAQTICLDVAGSDRIPRECGRFTACNATVERPFDGEFTFTPLEL